jgi:hypothetical protein
VHQTEPEKFDYEEPIKMLRVVLDRVVVDATEEQLGAFLTIPAFQQQYRLWSMCVHGPPERATPPRRRQDTPCGNAAVPTRTAHMPSPHRYATRRLELAHLGRPLEGVTAHRYWQVAKEAVCAALRQNNVRHPRQPLACTGCTLLRRSVALSAERYHPHHPRDARRPRAEPSSCR